MTSTDEANIALVLELERELQTPEARGDQERLRELLAPTFIEIGASGHRWDLPAILEMLGDESAGSDVPEIEIIGLKGRAITSGVIQVFWDSRRNGRRARRTSIWHRTRAGWQQVFHQGTLLS